MDLSDASAAPAASSVVQRRLSVSTWSAVQECRSASGCHESLHSSLTVHAAADDDNDNDDDSDDDDTNTAEILH